MAGVDDAAQDPMVAFLDALLMNAPADADAVLASARRWRATADSPATPPSM